VCSREKSAEENLGTQKEENRENYLMRSIIICIFLIIISGDCIKADMVGL
jgi:hypothetical protein